MDDPFLIALALIALVLVGVTTISGRGAARRTRRQTAEEYDFYPFNREREPRYRVQPREVLQRGGRYFLDHRNSRRRRGVDRHRPAELRAGPVSPRPTSTPSAGSTTATTADEVISDNEGLPGDYKWIVSLLGRSSLTPGSEILLHNLVNPYDSIVTLENGEVTGPVRWRWAPRTGPRPQTRRYQNEDKLNHRAQHRVAPVQVHDHLPSHRGGLLIGGGVRQHRRAVHPGGGALEPRPPRRIHREPSCGTERSWKRTYLSPDQIPAALLRGKRALPGRGDRGNSAARPRFDPRRSCLRHRRLQHDDGRRRVGATRPRDACSRIRPRRCRRHGVGVLEELRRRIRRQLRLGVGRDRQPRRSRPWPGPRGHSSSNRHHLGEVARSVVTCGDGGQDRLPIESAASRTIVALGDGHNNVRNKGGVGDLRPRSRDLKGLDARSASTIEV